MNTTEFDTQIDAAMENCDYDSDDVILGDINDDATAETDEVDDDALMESVLESLCEMDDETLTETIKALDDDSVCAIYMAATEAIDIATEASNNSNPNNNNAPKTPKAPEMKKLSSADVIAKNRGTGILGTVKDTILAGGRNKLDAATIDAIHNLGVNSGTNAYKRSQLMTSKASEQDKLRVGAGFDASTKNNRDQVLALVKSKTKDPRAIAAAMDLYNKSSKAQVSNHQAHKLSMDTWRNEHKAELDNYKKKQEAAKKAAQGKADRKKWEAEMQKKDPKAWAQYQKTRSRDDEDKLFDRVEKIGGGKYKDTVDKLRHEAEKNRNDSDMRDDEYKRLKNLDKLDPKAAARERKRNQLNRLIEKRNRDELVDTINSARKEYIGNLVNNEMPTFVNAAKKTKGAAIATKNAVDRKSKAYHAARAAGKGLRDSIKDFVTASTGEDTGLASDLNVELIMESISENGFGAYAFALENAYTVINEMISMSDEDFADCMDAMSCTEAVEFTENLNFICDVLDDFEEFEAGIEAALNEIDYAAEDATPAPAPQPTNTDNQQKPGIGTRIKNFITGAGASTGFRDRVKAAATGLRDRVSRWWKGDQSQNQNGQQPQNQNQNNQTNNSQNDQGKNGQQPQKTQKQIRREKTVEAMANQAKKDYNNSDELKQKQMNNMRAGAQTVDKGAQAELKERLMKEKAAKVAQQNLDAANGGNAAKFGKTVSQKDIDAAKKQISNNAYAHQHERDAESRRKQISATVNSVKQGVGNFISGAKKVLTPNNLKPATASVGVDFDENTFKALLEAYNFVQETQDIYEAFESMSTDEINAAFESMNVEEAELVNDVFAINDILDAIESAYEMLADSDTALEDVSDLISKIYDSDFGAVFECYMGVMIADAFDDESDDISDALESMSMDEFAEFIDSCSYDELLAIEAVYVSNDAITLENVVTELLDMDSDAMESIVTSLDPITFDLVMNTMTNIVCE